ncbi:hypothetical protein OG288_34025 [Streptomyces tauricus]|uniref:Uncharacterized protein n=1 Tax=Streptomyces tauricus TaxID=68274 RepID=A0ABZ1JZ15_9ACTN|nr:hypothetical protein [Streptomyces tauricus]
MNDSPRNAPSPLTGDALGGGPAGLAGTGRSRVVVSDGPCADGTLRRAKD